mmetsp:Transcript_14336/g.16264  ORF Transcript_14336/g.16264 Transcript_14336/m.16264 type:complete len:570 (+) Transcript_14336:228-1937(+)
MSSSFPVIIMTKAGYLLSALITSLFFHRVVILNEGSYLRSTGTSFTGYQQQQHDEEIKMNESANKDTPPLNMEGQTSSNTDASSNSTIISYTSEANADMITDLPGLTFTPSFNQFSGYLSVSSTRKIHYWYIESMNKPSSDPVVFWTNGGPGCSGLLGLGTEMGPFIFEDGKLSPNPFTWNTIANILYVEQPAGVGFSVFTDPSDKEVGDERAALDNYQLIKEFFDRFPERKHNEFYIASESFGGHYIPHLAKTILDHQNEENSINFRGFLVGNPYVDPFSNDVTMFQTYYMHGLIALPLFMKWEEYCTDPNNYDVKKCDGLAEDMMEGAGSQINPYALDYPACLEPDNNDYPPQKEGTYKGSGAMVVNSQSTGISMTNRIMTSSQASRLVNVTSIRPPPFLPREDVYHPCAEAHLFTYLNRDDVKEALHVGNGKNWSMCSNDIEYSEEDSNRPQMDLYVDLISRGRVNGSNLKMMVFSGDDDSICSTASTQYWIWSIGADPIHHEVWKPWKYENQTAGYLTQFDLGDTDSSFIFVTVHGAGHEVPAYRPAEALAMFTSFFSGEWDTQE